MKQWFTILKRTNGTVLLFDPREGKAEDIFERDAGKYLNTVSEYKWIPIKVKDAGGTDDAPSVKNHILEIENKLGNSLSDNRRNKMIKLDYRDFMSKAEENGIGFLYIAPINNWRNDIPKHYKTIGGAQGNGLINLLTMVGFPFNYWHYNSDFSNKNIIHLDHDNKAQTFRRVTSSKMGDAIRKILNDEEKTKETFSDDRWHYPKEDYSRYKADKVLDRNGDAITVAEVMKKVLELNMDRGW